MSPNFFLDTPGCGAKMNTPAFREFNAGVFVLRSAKRIPHGKFGLMSSDWV
jgi:hypothetical protein